MNGCVYKTASGQCQKYSDKHRNTLAWCCGDNIICKDRKLSNADLIRAMTDEELAELFASPCPNGLEPEDSCFYAISDGDDTVCKNCWLEWLKQEVKE